MNDRYLFRAKRIDNGKLIEGFLIFEKDRAFIAHRVCEVMNSYSKAGEEYGFGNFIEVDPSTICQCTGLKDRNGKLIWESDICDRKEPYPEIVAYTKGDWTLDYSYATGRERGSCYCNLGFYINERMSVSVIGNIFDNPELLKQEG